MARTSSGVYQLPNGYWGFRYAYWINGKQKDIKRTTDKNGNPFKTKAAAIKAREAAMIEAHAERTQKPIKSRMTVAEVFAEYCETGRCGKAYGTTRKQDSLWNNHISKRFGNRYIDDISVSEVNDYLSLLYHQEDRAYKYVEAFLKMFYLIFGQAYSRNYLDVDTYNTLCVNKNTKIHMPKRKIDDDNEIVSFSTEETDALDEYFRDTNAETAYLLGRYCGLRINECYGLLWSNIDFDNDCIHIEQQMQYQEGLITLSPLKTRNAKRTLYMNSKLKTYLIVTKESIDKAAAAIPHIRNQNQTMITDTNGKHISSLLLVNSLPNGKIQTVNSMKYHSRKIKETLGIDFKYHYLRHTYGTRLAEQNMPSHLLCNQMGHASSKVTEKYYIAISKHGMEIIKNKLEII
ncbi:MAG: tyrosine-type recombinase/integrase [Clostridia bacterium]|nr:tyrosine-type recombinase/integrase [Clostridia bacterium]